MTHATIQTWHIQPGQEVHSSQLILEVSTRNLTEDTNEEHLLDVEIHEDMFVAKIIGQPGDSLPAGAPLALFCDNAEDIRKADSFDVSDMMVNIVIGCFI
jgi:pyruvate/2-oxoglutarate dehydrogenase complex dihydrolipoamide acyltransferase (E2) component